MNAIAVHASALDAENDMFAKTTPQQATRGERLSIIGTLASGAEVRTKVASHGTSMPVLCLELIRIGPGNHRIHVEQIYPSDCRKEAEAMALTLRKGMRVTVVTPFADMHISLPHVESITPFASS